MELHYQIAKWSVIGAAVCLLVWFVTGWEAMRLCAIGAAWVYVLATVSRYIQERRMRRFIGIMLIVIGLGYSYRAIEQISAQTARDQSSMLTSALAGLACLAIGIALLVTAPRATSDNVP